MPGERQGVNKAPEVATGKPLPLPVPQLQYPEPALLWHHRNEENPVKTLHLLFFSQPVSG